MISGLRSARSAIRNFSACVELGISNMSGSQMRVCKNSPTTLPLMWRGRDLLGIRRDDADVFGLDPEPTAVEQVLDVPADDSDFFAVEPRGGV